MLSDTTRLALGRRPNYDMEWVDNFKRSFSLLIYLGLSRGNPALLGAEIHRRPKGDLVWLHVPNLTRLAATLHFIDRLCVMRPDLNVLVTTVVKTRPDDLPREILWSPISSEHPAAVENFLSHWRPDLCLWSYGSLRPSVIHNTAKRRIPLFLIDVDETSFPSRRWRWFPGLRQTLLRQFDRILVANPRVGQYLVDHKVLASAIESSGLLPEGKVALLCDPQEHVRLTQGFKGRPTWLAMGLCKQEIQAVILAQKHAMRVAHRLLLVAVPDKSDDFGLMVDHALEMGLKASIWQADQMPGDNVQVLVVQNQHDMALWYRLCPISFLGKTLASDTAAFNPYDAIALGSAVLHGPHVSPHAAAFARLSAAGAARQVDNADDIGEAVMALIASDLCATMAVAGWQVLTEGAGVCDRLVDLVCDRLEQPKEL